MAKFSVCLNQLGMIEEQVRSSADAATEQARAFLAEQRVGSLFSNRRPIWHAAVKTISIAIDLAEIERRQDSLLSLLRSGFYEPLSPHQILMAAAKLDETVKSLNHLLQVAQASPPLAYHFWKNRLHSLREKTEQIDNIAEGLHMDADWGRAARRGRTSVEEEPEEA